MNKMCALSNPRIWIILWICFCSNYWVIYNFRK